MSAPETLFPVTMPTLLPSYRSASIPAVSPAMAVAVVQAVPDPLYGIQATLVSPPAAGYDFAGGARQSVTGIDVGLVDVPLGASLDLEVISGLRFWSGRGNPVFAPVTGGVELNLEAAGADIRIGANTDRDPGRPSGSVRKLMGVAVSDGLPSARQIRATIGTGGTRESFLKPGAPSGIYFVTGIWSLRDATGIRDSAPVTFVFALGTVSRQARDTAVDWFSNPAGRPVAIVAVATQVVVPDGPGQKFLRVNLLYSDPVTVTGRAPQMPIQFGGRTRHASIEPGSRTVATRNLSFTIVPTAAELASAPVRLGDAVRLQSGATLRGASGAPAATSLPPEAARTRVTGFDGTVAFIVADITRDTTWRRGRTYIIEEEVHVRPGVTLTIDDGVKVLIRNGYQPVRTINASCLIFDSGSRLRAKTVTFGSCDDQNRQTASPNNGGVFFLGTSRSCTKDGISVVPSAGGRSSFMADLLVFNSLGRVDPRYGDGNDRDDIDAVSLLGLGNTEWLVKAVRTLNAADDGFDVTNSSITLDSLTVVNPVEDGLNITSSTVVISRSLLVTMSPSVSPDRELFDFEVADGAARVLIRRLASVDLSGYWGNAYDEVNLNSLDMPAPPRRAGASQWYSFVGVLRRGPALVYSTIAD